MPDFDSLKITTEAFFQLHWSFKQKPYPRWCNEWTWTGPLTDHARGGLYALLDERDELLYVGLGVSRSLGRYSEHGISRRLLSHVVTTARAPDGSKVPGTYTTKARWQNVEKVCTLGFAPDVAYLAPSLEFYLISQLKPPRNKTGKI